MTGEQGSFRITGKHVLAAFVAFFAVVIVVDTIFVRMAIKSYPGEEVEKSYYQGLHYNDVLAEKERQLETGWRMQLVTVPGKADEAIIEVRVLTADGEAVFDADVRGEIVRPMTDAGQRALTFIPISDGLYRARLAEIGRGAWDLSLSAGDPETGDTALQAKTRFVVP